MRVLVTGGAGYIGSHAIRSLRRAGHDVVVLDNLSHGHRQAVADCEFVEGDIASEGLVAGILRTYGIEAVLHFAAFIEVGESVVDPDKYYRNNLVGALSLLRAMRAEGVRRIVFSSTAAVYGDPHSVPIEESHDLAPVSPYGRSKMMVELVLKDFAAAYGLGYAILRYFNVAGASPDEAIGEAHEPESHLIPRILISAALGQAKVSIYGTDYATSDGTCVRDYIHVEDLVNAHLIALEKIRPGEGAVYNLGSERGFSVREVIRACERVTGREVLIEEHPRRPGDAAILVASSGKIRSELGWRREYPDLETIIAHAWKWHKDHPRGFRSQSTMSVETATAAALASEPAERF